MSITKITVDNPTIIELNVLSVVWCLCWSEFCVEIRSVKIANMDSVVMIRNSVLRIFFHILSFKQIDSHHISFISYEDIPLKSMKIKTNSLSAG